MFTRRRNNSALEAHPPDTDASTAFVAGWGAVFAYAVLRQGAVLPEHWNLCLLAVGALSLAYWSWGPGRRPGPGLEGWLRWCLPLLPVYVAWQLIPLPDSVLGVLSPARAELLASVKSVVPAVRFAPISVLPSATAAHLLRICAYLAVLLLARDLAWRCRHRRWLLAIPVVAVAGMEALLGLIPFLGAAGQAAARGTYVNRNHFSGLLETALPFALLYPVGVLARRDGRSSALKAGAMAVLAAMILMGVLLSFSRAGFLATLVSITLLAALGFRHAMQRVAATASRRKKWLRAGAVAVVAALTVFTFLHLASDRLIARFAEVASSTEISTEGRLALWRETLDLIRVYPWAGCGLGAYEPAFSRYKVSTPSKADDYAHNDYLQLLAELGLGGFILFAAVPLAIFRRVLRTVWRTREPSTFYLALACLGSLVVAALHALVDFNLYIPANALLIAWACGIAAGIGRLENYRPALEGAVDVPPSWNPSKRAGVRSIAEGQ